jgi:hypothetical protein
MMVILQYSALRRVVSLLHEDVSTSWLSSASPACYWALVGYTPRKWFAGRTKRGRSASDYKAR